MSQLHDQIIWIHNQLQYPVLYDQFIWLRHSFLYMLRLLHLLSALFHDYVHQLFVQLDH